MISAHIFRQVYIKVSILFNSPGHVINVEHGIYKGLGFPAVSNDHELTLESGPMGQITWQDH